MKKVLIFSFILLASSCGWHLRGNLTPALNIQSIAITPVNSKIAEPLTKQLTQQDIAVIDAEGAEYQLMILAEGNERRVVGVGSDALANAYEITLSVHYQLQNLQAELLGSAGTVKISRSYNYAASDPSSAQKEEQLLSTEIRRELAQQILRRLSILLHKNQESANGESLP